MVTVTVDRLTRLANGTYDPAPRAALIDDFHRGRAFLPTLDLPVASLVLTFQSLEPARGDLYRIGGSVYRIETVKRLRPFWRMKECSFVPHDAPVHINVVTGAPIVAGWGGEMVADWGGQTVADWV